MKSSRLMRRSALPEQFDRIGANLDWGDRQTWILIVAMCLFALFMALSAYLLPHGRDSAMPMIKVF